MTVLRPRSPHHDAPSHAGQAVRDPVRLDAESDLARADRIEIRAEKAHTRGAETDLSDSDGFVTMFHARDHKQRDSLRKSSGIAVALRSRTTTKSEYGNFSASTSGSGNRPHFARRVCHRSRTRRSTRRDWRSPAMGTRGGGLIIGGCRRRRDTTDAHHSDGSTRCGLNA
jgi:hypothetical protein